MSEEAKHSPEPWGAFRLDVSGTDEFKAYTARCIDQGAPEDFYIVMVDKPDGSADVCHVGNGPTSAENARRIVAAVNAVAGIPTAALESGALAKALDALVICEASGSCGEYGRHAFEALRALGRLEPTP
jgi:hypothetical protein